MYGPNEGTKEGTVIPLYAKTSMSKTTLVLLALVTEPNTLNQDEVVDKLT